MCGSLADLSRRPASFGNSRDSTDHRAWQTGIYERRTDEFKIHRHACRHINTEIDIDIDINIDIKML